MSNHLQASSSSASSSPSASSSSRTRSSRIADTRASQSSRITIVGAGATGLVQALALAHLGHVVTLIGPPDTRRTGRTVALFDGSLRLLKHIGVWPHLEPMAAPLALMRIIDDTGSLFRQPPASFSARELGLEAFGANIENGQLVACLADLVAQQPLIHHHKCFVQHYEITEDHVTLTLDEGTRLDAALVIAADGYKSAARAAAGLALKEWSYPQTALTCLLGHQMPHQDISTEFHTRHGPFTLVPLVPGPQGENRSSLVWLNDPAQAQRLASLPQADLARAIERQAQSFLGKMQLETPPFLFPMRGFTATRFAANRIALIGEAAHGFPPIGAQGLNLGLRDVAALADCLDETRLTGTDPGAAALLQAYEDSRGSDVALRTRGVDMLNRSLLTPLLPVDALRGLGLLALSTLAPLRKWVMATGVKPQGRQPRLMQPLPAEA